MRNEQQQQNERYQAQLHEIAYYLADAETKKHTPVQARVSLNTAKNLLQQFRTANPQSRVDRFPASVKTTEGVRWGYIDDRGRFAISPRYQYANDFQENGLAVVTLNGRSGLITRTGQYVIPPMYDTITPFTEGRALVLDDKGYRVIDESGKILTTKWYTYIGSYQDGRAMFTSGDQSGSSAYGFLDRSGKEVIPARYVSANNFSNGKAVVQIKEGEYALIDKNGQRLQTYPFAYVGPLGDGLLAYRKAPGFDTLSGYINEQGKEVIPPRYSVALPFEKGRAIVNGSTDLSQSNKYGMIDKTGKETIKLQYNDVERLGEDRVALGTERVPGQSYAGSRYAIAEMNGRPLTGFLYKEVAPYKEGYASVTDGRRTFFLDRNGRQARNLPVVNGAGTLTLMGNVVQANVDQRISYYDRAGNLIYAQNTLIPLRGRYQVREEKYAPNPDYLVYYPQIEGMTNRTDEARINQLLKDRSQVKPIPPNQELDYTYTGDFEVAFFQKDLVVLELMGYNYPDGAAHGMPSRDFVHIDLVRGKVYQLKDLFYPNSNYVKVISDIIGNQIKTDPQYSYVFPDSYKGISPNQLFSVTDTALLIYFAPYEIAPYAAGFPMFRIPYTEIDELINRNGDFWKAYH